MNANELADYINRLKEQEKNDVINMNGCLRHSNPEQARYYEGRVDATREIIKKLEGGTGPCIPAKRWWRD